MLQLSEYDVIMRSLDRLGATGTCWISELGRAASLLAFSKAAGINQSRPQT